MSVFETNDLVVCVSNYPANETNLGLDKFYIVTHVNPKLYRVSIADLSGKKMKWSERSLGEYDASRFKKSIYRMSTRKFSQTSIKDSADVQIRRYGQDKKRHSMHQL